MDIVDLSERLWRGEDLGQKTNPLLGAVGHFAEITTSVAFLPNFANCTAISTDDGLVMVDTGSPLTAEDVHRRDTNVEFASSQLRHLLARPHRSRLWGREPSKKRRCAEGWPTPRVLAHAHLPRRFDRYILTAGYNEVINQRQFAAPNLRWPREYRYPDETYEA